jgi:8-oxo-dGTP diphosphatase
MCLIYDEKRVLVQEKLGLKEKYKGGLVFPGGHVEPDESLLESVIREMKEETGLTIYNPQPCGFKDWILEDGTRYIVLLYKTDQFEGELKSSEEGRVFWLGRDEIGSANLIWNMRELMQIFETNEFSEFFFKIKDGKYIGELLG